MEADTKKLQLSLVDCVRMAEWFQFVDNRTNVDTRLHKKLLQAIEVIKKCPKGTGCVFMRRQEAELITRWYLMTPEIAKDLPDQITFHNMQLFIQNLDNLQIND